MWECPDFFELDGKWVLLTSPQDMLPEGFEYHNGNGTLCLIGEYDEETGTFTEEHDQAIDYGIDFYATQTILTPDGRRVMIGWMQKNGWLKLGKESDHPKILSKGGGWSVTARGSRHMHPPAYHKEKVDGYAQWMRAQGELTGPADRPQLTPKGMAKVYGTGGPDAVSRPFSVEAWLEEQGFSGALQSR